MIDPLTAFATAQAAVAAIKKGIELGKDIGGISSDLATFAGAISDVNFAHKAAENAPWYAVLFDTGGPNAMEIFAQRKQAEAMRAEIKQYIQFSYGQSAWEELLHIEAQVRKERKATLYRQAEVKQAIIEWVLGLLIVASGFAGVAFLIYFIGKQQGRW
jgi:hypothetical protein